jgi:hypothetical protein
MTSSARSGGAVEPGPLRAASWGGGVTISNRKARSLVAGGEILREFCQREPSLGQEFHSMNAIGD